MVRRAMIRLRTYGESSFSNIRVSVSTVFVRICKCLCVCVLSVLVCVRQCMCCVCVERVYSTYVHSVRVAS